MYSFLFNARPMRLVEMCMWGWEFFTRKIFISLVSDKRLIPSQTHIVSTRVHADNRMILSVFIFRQAIWKYRISINTRLSLPNDLFVSQKKTIRSRLGRLQILYASLQLCMLVTFYRFELPFISFLLLIWQNKQILSALLGSTAVSQKFTRSYYALLKTLEQNIERARAFRCSLCVLSCSFLYALVVFSQLDGSTALTSDGGTLVRRCFSARGPTMSATRDSPLDEV